MKLKAENLSRTPPSQAVTQAGPTAPTSASTTGANPKLRAEVPSPTASGNIGLTSRGPAQPIHQLALTASGKTFVLEGLRGNLLEAISIGTANKGTCPTLGTRLFPALNTLLATIGQLGKRPTPEEVDRSNVRRLIRAIEPVLGALSAQYPKKKLSKATKQLKALARALGNYKDVHVIRTELAAACPDGVIPEVLESKLDRLQDERREVFESAYKKFRKTKMNEAIEVLGAPHRVKKSEGPAWRVDRKAFGKEISRRAASTRGLEVDGQEPERFHDGRKALRRTLNTLHAASHWQSLPKERLEQITSSIDSMGAAQDIHIAESWLEEQQGFPEIFESIKARHHAAIEVSLGVVSILNIPILYQELEALARSLTS